MIECTLGGVYSKKLGLGEPKLSHFFTNPIGGFGSKIRPTNISRGLAIGSCSDAGFKHFISYFLHFFSLQLILL